MVDAMSPHSLQMSQTSIKQTYSYFTGLKIAWISFYPSHSRPERLLEKEVIASARSTPAKSFVLQMAINSTFLDHPDARPRRPSGHVNVCWRPRDRRRADNHREQLKKAPRIRQESAKTTAAIFS
jgi:hypothetical protein